MINLNLTYEEAEALQQALTPALEGATDSDLVLVKVASRLGSAIIEEWNPGTTLMPLHVPVIVNCQGNVLKATRVSLADSYHPKFQEITYNLADGRGDVTVDLDTSKFSWRRL
ncbi:hypothetical protein vBPMCPL1_0062 [Proteus phage vB_PMC-PL1]